VVLYKGSGPIKSVAKGVLRPLISRLVDVQLLNERTDLEARRISLGESDRVGCLFEGCKLGTTSFPRKGFEQMVELPFEGTMQPCMSCWDEYLTNRYGDYMTLPPEGERRDHGIKAWRV
jgi:lipopolysaccharide cholinephosphotransferase